MDGSRRYNGHGFFFDSDGYPAMLHLGTGRFHRIRLPYIGQPITILSSSFGCVLCRDSANSYHVFNPLSNGSPLHMALPNPGRHHANTTPAVLAFHQHPFWPTDITDIPFRVICAVQVDHGRYSFDTFCSRSRTWTLDQAPIDLPDHPYGSYRIRLNTGVSCGGLAFWLTDHNISNSHFPLLVIHDPSTMTTSIVDSRPQSSIGHEMRFQLGRVRNDLGLVVLNNVGFEADLFFLMDDREWRPRHASSSLVYYSQWGPCRAQTRLPGALTLPLPLRFESDELEILLYAGGRLLLWESSGGDETRLVAVNDNNAPVPQNIANGVPYFGLYEPLAAAFLLSPRL